MADQPNSLYFRIRENGATVFRVDTENRQRRIEMDQIAELSRAFETDLPVEISFWVFDMLVLIVRRVCSATMAELLVRIEDIGIPLS